jgi:large subunit ribosomal protein L22
MTKGTTAEFRHVRISPTKLRGLVNLVRGQRVEDAIDILRLSPRGGASVILKLVKSAVANVDVQGALNVDKLKIGAITVNEGPRLRRFRPRSRGMAAPIRKRTSHLNIELVERR